MYKRYKSGHHSNRTVSDGNHGNPEPDQSARRAQSVTEAVISRGLSNLSVTDLRHASIAPEADPEILKKVEQCWEEVDQQCINYRRPRTDRGLGECPGWKTVRVFVSSTFTDFFCEREILVKKVFPELREWCRGRLLYLVECDLRWGVPKDSTTTEAIVTCLEELDRCIEENNGEPFFLNMIGERYGWIPSEQDIPVDVRTKYNWVANTSITFMEILHGAYRMKSSNALFMFRDPEVMKDIPETHISRFKDTDPLCQEQLKQLKTRLQARFLNQVEDYSCQVEGLVTQHEKDNVKLTGLEDFGDKVLNFFKSAIDRQYPERDKLTPLSSIEQENLSHKRFVDEVAGTMLGREAEIEILLGYAMGNIENLQFGETKKPFSRDPKFWGAQLGDSTLLCLLGTQGYGKTTLMAKIVQLASKNDLCVFYHFCGSTGTSHHVSLLLQRLVDFLDQDNSSDSSELSEEELRVKLKSLLVKESIHENGRRILLVFDAVNQLSSSESVDHLKWLPPLLPSNMRCIVTTAHHPPTVSRIQEHPHYIVELLPLSQNDAKQIVQRLLLRYSKKLDTDQLELILSSKCTQSPLWLYLVCEELRVYGDFRTLTKKVKTVTTSVEGMLTAIFRRLISEDETGNLEKMLSILSCANGTLTTLDMQRMLGDVSKKEPLPLLTWRSLHRMIKAYLRIAHYNEQIVFAHDAIRKAVCEMLVTSRAVRMKWYRLLANYIEYWCEDKAKLINDLPYYLEQADLKDRLVHFLREVPESAQIPDFRRSRFFMTCRCRHLADLVVQKNTPVIICTFCKMAKAKFHPCGYHRNERMCVMCGGQLVHGPQFSHPAALCPFHAPHGGVGPPMCFLCGNVAQVQTSVSGMLCQHCGFGNYGKQCVAITKH